MNLIYKLTLELKNGLIYELAIDIRLLSPKDIAENKILYEFFKNEKYRF